MVDASQEFVPALDVEHIQTARDTQDGCTEWDERNIANLEGSGLLCGSDAETADKYLKLLFSKFSETVVELPKNDEGLNIARLSSQELITGMGAMAFIREGGYGLGEVLTIDASTATSSPTAVEKASLKIRKFGKYAGVIIVNTCGIDKENEGFRRIQEDLNSASLSPTIQVGVLVPDNPKVPDEETIDMTLQLANSVPERELDIPLDHQRLGMTSK